MALLALILLAYFRLFTRPSASHRDLVRLVRFVRTFLQAPARSEVPRDNCLMIAAVSLEPHANFDRRPTTQPDSL
jgi:hypothetical protein